MKKYFMLLLLITALIMPKNVFGKVKYADNIPYQVEVLTGNTSTSPQSSVQQQTLLGNQYYGFTYGTQNYSYGLKFNYNEISSMNDKEIISAHFSLFTTALYSNSDFPLSVYLKDNYNNIITCNTNGWSTNTYDSVGGSGTELRSVLTASCNNGHLSGPYSVIVNNRFYHYVGFVGISEVSFMYSDGVDDSTILNDIKSNSNDIKNNTKETNDLIKNTDTSTAQSEGSNFFSNFSRDSHGLSGIVTAPLRLLNSFTTATCNPLEFNLPILHNHVVLPCMRSIYENYFGVFFSLYQLITTGVICYGVGINLYSKLRALENPNNDRIEVLQL